MMQRAQGHAARVALRECLFKHRIARQVTVRKTQPLARLLRLQGRQCGMASEPWQGRAHGPP